MGIVIEYNSNNSGGRWWLTDKDWLALKKAGWKVKFADDNFVYVDGQHKRDSKGFPVFSKKVQPGGFNFTKKDDKGVSRYMGALANYAFKRFDSVKDALVEFEKVTGKDVMDEGCNCCGAPHSFSWDGGYCSGESCGEHLFGTTANKSKRELLESRNPNQ